MFGNSQIAMLRTSLANAEQRRSKGYSTRVAAWDSKRAAGRPKLNEDETRFARQGRLEQEAAEADIKSINEQIRHIEAEQHRAGASNPMVQAVKRGGGETAGMGSALAPLGFDEKQLRALHQSVLAQQPMRLEARAFNSVDSMLPPQLWQTIVGPRHEGRILDRIPAFPLSAPSLEYIQHTSTTGAAGVVAEGAAKPEAVFTLNKVIASAVKIAVHAGLSWEIAQDWDNFVSYVQTELMNLCIDAENLQFLSGTGSSGQMTGLAQHQRNLDTRRVQRNSVGYDRAVHHGAADRSRAGDRRFAHPQSGDLECCAAHEDDPGPVSDAGRSDAR